MNMTKIFSFLALSYILLCGVTRADINATYFDQNGQQSAYFTGSEISLIDANIDFNWGSGAPQSGMGSDDFSVRWDGLVQVPVDGDYTLRIRGDDGIRIWVDGNLLIDDWSNHGPRNRDSSPVTLSSGQLYSIVVEHYERGGGAVAQVSWSGPTTGGFQIIPAGNLFVNNNPPEITSAAYGCSADSITISFDKNVDPVTAENINNYALDNGASIFAANLDADGRTVVLQTSSLTEDTYTVTINNILDTTGNAIAANSTVAASFSILGLTATYYDQNNTSGAYFTGSTVEQIDPEVDFNWGSGAPVSGIGSDRFSVRWEGFVVMPDTDNYEFRTRSDDGVRLWIDNVLVVDNWTNHGPTYDYSASIPLVAGQQYAVRMEYFENSGGAVAQLQWQNSSFGWQTIPQAQLRGTCGLPTLVAATFSCSSNEIQVNFSEPVDVTTAEDINNYSISDGISISNATLSTGGSTVILETDFLGASQFDVIVSNVEDTSGNTIEPDSTVSAMVQSTGLAATYFDQDGISRAYFTGNTVEQIDAIIDNNWGTSAPVTGIGADDFSVRWEGYIEAPTDGDYTFRSRSDDGFRLYLDNVQIIDHWSDHGPSYRSSAAQTLVGGQVYRFVAEYYERGGGAVAELEWSGPGISMQTIPADRFVGACGLAAAEWRMEELSWTGATGEVIDATGGRHNGTVFGIGTGPGDIDTSVADAAIRGNPGTCRYGEFDGVDDYIEIADSGDLDNTTQLTLSAWFKADTLTQTNGTNARGLFSKRPSFSSNVSYGAFFLNGGSNRLYVDIDGTNNRFRSNTSFVADTWYHVAIVFDGNLPAAQRVSLYVDGALDGTFTESSGAIPDTNSNFYIGNLYTGLSQLKVFDGAIDEVNVIPLAFTSSEVTELMNATRPCAAVQVFLDIDTNGNAASTCAPQTITVRACEDVACNLLVDDYDGTVDLSVSTNHGDWSINAGSGTLTDTVGDDGIATYTFDDVNDNGRVELDLSNTHAETLTVTASDVSLGVSTTSSDLTFGDNVFVIENGDNLHIAGRDQAMTAALYTNDGSNCAVNPLYNGGKVVKAWLDRDVADPAATAPLIDTISIPDTSSTTFNLEFVAGVASFDFATTDVGKYIFNIVDDTLSFSDQPIVGDTAIVTRPFGLYLQARGAAGESNPAAASAGGSAFMAAGNDFLVDVFAVTWEAADDTDNNGVPDGHDNSNPADNTDLSNNSRTSSFGLEGDGQSESVAVVAYPVSPDLVTSTNVLEDGGAGCANCIVSGFSAGAGTSGNVHYANVGIIELQAALVDGNYLGSETVIGASGYVGRFIPDRFELQNPAITPADTSATAYTYMGQPFLVDYDLVALNALGDVTDNYKDDYAKLDITNEGAFADLGPSVDIAYGAADSSPMELTPRLSVGTISPSTTWVDGRIMVLGLEMTIDKGSAEDGPFSTVGLGLNVQDSDGVSFSSLNLEVDGGSAGDDALQIAGTPGEIRFGRTFFPPVYGPEVPSTEVLNIPFSNQYWNGSNFITNIDDNITVYEDWTSTCADADTGDGLSCPDSTVTVPSLIDPAEVLVVSGEDDDNYPITISRPGADNAGPLDITFAVDSWLQFDWNGTGDVDPTTRVDFGRYRGHDRIIYWREQTN